MCKYSCHDDVYDSLVSYFRCQPLLSTVKVSGHFRVTENPFDFSVKCIFIDFCILKQHIFLICMSANFKRRLIPC